MQTIALFSTSTRNGSFNQKLVECAAKRLREQNRVNVEVIDLSQYEMPLLHADLALPENVLRLHSLLLKCDAWVISTCEYNGSISPLIKNTLDWLSIVKTTETSLFNQRVIWLMSASAGSFGGIRSLVHLQSVLWQLGAHVLPAPLCVTFAAQAFDEIGNLKELALKNRLDKALLFLLKTIRVV